MRPLGKIALLAIICAGLFIANVPGALGCCNIPTQETTQYFSSWNYPPYYDIGSNFVQTIYDSLGDSWDNDNVEEAFPWKGYDSCYYGPGDQVGDLSTDNNSDTWPVLAGNTWGPDLNGWLVSDAYYYQSYYSPNTNCGLQYTQEMLIQLNCGDPLYQPYTTNNYVSAPGNTLFLTLGQGWEQSIREEFSSSSLVYGAKLPCCNHP